MTSVARHFGVTRTLVVPGISHDVCRTLYHVKCLALLWVAIVICFKCVVSSGALVKATGSDRRGCCQDLRKMCVPAVLAMSGLSAEEEE
eukprot:364570-Chlamydomonas_euryale.AAC.9